MYNNHGVSVKQLHFTVLTICLLAATLFGQTPDTLKLTAKLRDFLEINPKGIGPVNPDFNSDVFNACPDKGYVDTLIETNGLMDATVFKNDNRGPKLVRTVSSYGHPCYTSVDKFEDWYNDRDPGSNRPFLVDLDFKRLANGMYEFNDDTFFPLDDGGPYRNLPGNNLTTFGQLQTCCAHNYGFTMEFHAYFTYLEKTGQVFNFKGDDDVWVFINGKLVIDLGGIHGPENASVNLDSAAARLGLQNHESYLLDFFFAERHTSGSKCRITTSLELGSQKVATPVATPGSSNFLSQVSVSLATPTPDAVIYYTLDGKTPDSTSTRWNASAPLSLTVTTTVKAIAYKAGWSPSDVMTETYAKTPTASTLEILDQNGNPLVGGYLTEKNAAYSIRVTTTQAGLDKISAVAVTRVGRDQEVLDLASKAVQNDRFQFTAAAPFAFSAGKAAVSADGKTEASSYDTLFVKWVNPTDPSDVASAQVPVRPAPVQARAYFSTKPDGSDTTDQYAGTEAKIYLVVLDEVLPATLMPTITLETTPKIGSGRVKDQETLVLPSAPTVPGKYVFTIPVDLNPTSKPGDNKLQLAVEDLIKAVYSDAMDAEDPAVASAGFGISPEIDASLQFTDAKGVVLPAGTFYSPANGKLYLSYSDDWVGGSIPSVIASLTIENDNGRAPADTETVTLALNPAKHIGSKGVWEGSIQLSGAGAVSVGNKIAETYILGHVTAVVPAHDKLGHAAGSASDELLVAYPNQDAQVMVEGEAGWNRKITRSDAWIRISIADQSFTDGIDTLYASVSCTESRDYLNRIRLIEKAGSPGNYESEIIAKSEESVWADTILQCLSRDNIKVTYTDPVYGDAKEVQALIDEPLATRLYYSLSATDIVPTGTVSDASAKFFYAVVEARSPSVSKVDSLTLTFTTPQGEQESFIAVETGPFTQKFIAKIPFAFVNGDRQSANGILEAKINLSDADNRVLATGAVTVDGAQAKANILLTSEFDPLLQAYIKDVDGNGAADKVYLVFERKLPRLPEKVDAQWNRSASPMMTAAAPDLSFLNDDSLVVVADYSKQPFPQGLTSLPAGEAPKAKLPYDALFAGQWAVIADSIGPVLVSAFKHPGVANPAVPHDPAFFHDTLVVTVSEPIVSAKDFKRMLKFATSCDDYDKAITIDAMLEPIQDPADPLTFKVIVDNSTGVSPQVSNCIFLNADAGLITDLAGNPPAKLGVPLDGSNRSRVIQTLRGYPPVSGLDPNRPEFQVAVQDSRDPDKDAYSTGSGSDWQMLWIPPVGWQDGREFQPYTVNSLDELASGNPETSTPVRMPEDISAIQVVSSSGYEAHVTIFDIYGNLVSSSVQAFGARGELKNLARAVPKGIVSYLYWNQKDNHGQLAGQGVYVWRVLFKFKTGKNEIQYTRTGLLRQKLN